MKIGLLTDSLSAMSRTEVFDFAVEAGIETIELAMGNWSSAPHADLETLLKDSSERNQLKAELTSRGLVLEALNASGNQLHPVEGPHDDGVLRDTIRLASEFEVDTIVVMSGLPAAKGDRFPAWITSVWPPENLELLEYQWNEVAIPYWLELVDFAAAQGLKRIAVEMHACELVYSVPSLWRLREAVGPMVGANFDPSHLMWMGADPIAAAKALAGAVYHVHAKDTRIENAVAVRSRLETEPNPRCDVRAWNFSAVGTGNPGGVGFWRNLATTVQAGGYDGAFSIENEDYSLPAPEAVRIAAQTLHAALDGLHG